MLKKLFDMLTRKGKIHLVRTKCNVVSFNHNPFLAVCSFNRNLLG